MSNNYTLGRGELHFAQYVTGTTTPKGERYLGNSPEFNLSIENENLDHFNSDRGVREKDDSITLQSNRTGSFTTDNVSPENLALFFFGSKSIFTAAGGAITGEAIDGVEHGLGYQLGASAGNPTGARNISAVTINKGATPLVLGTDYTVDLELGRIVILEGSVTVVDGDDLTANYTVAASQRERVVSGSQAIEGQLRYISYNAAGEQRDFLMPRVKITPNGDFALKGDEWQVIPFTIEVLKKTGLEAIYADGRAFAP